MSSKKRRQIARRQNVELQRAQQDLARVDGHTISVSTGVSYSGPLPPPQLLKAFDEVSPGAAQVIIDMAKNQSAHRISMEAQALSADHTRSWWGLGLGFVFSMTCVGVAAWLAMMGREVAAAAIVAAPVLGIAGVFITGAIARSSERKDRMRAMLEHQHRG